MRIRLLSVMTCLCLLFCLIASAEAAGEPTTTSRFDFNPTWSIEASDSFDGTLGALGVGVSVGFNYDFDAGVSLPVALNVEHPRYILEGGSATVNITAEGAQNGRAWAYASGGVHASINAGPFGSYSLVDRSISLGDEVGFETPFGAEDTITFNAEMLLGSQTVNLLIDSITFELYIRVTVDVVASTWLSSDLSITGAALTSPVQDTCQWAGESDIETASFSVEDETGTFVDMEFQNVVMHVERLSFVLQSMSFHLRADGSEVAAIPIPLPAFEFTFATDEGQYSENEYIIPLADASGSTRDLESKILSIHVGVPLPNIPGILLMVIPSIGGVVYGRRSEKGSKGIGAVLLAAVILGAAIYLGLDFLSQTSSSALAATFVTGLIPPIDVGGDVLTLVLGYLPWMLAGIAVGGATKNLKTGAILGLIAPLTLFALNGLLQGDLQMLTSVTDAVPAVIAGSIAAGFGILGAVLAQSGEKQVVSSVASKPVETPPSPGVQPEERYTSYIPVSEEDLDTSVGTSASTVPVAKPMTQKKPAIDMRKKRTVWSRTYFEPSATVLNLIALTSIIFTLIQFGSEAIYYGNSLGVFLASILVGPLDPYVFAALAFTPLGQGIAILGMAILTILSTRAIHGDKRDLSKDVSVSGEIIGAGLLGGLITFIILAKYILIALIAIGVAYMVVNFGGMFASWGARPEEVVMIAAIGAIPFILITFSLLLVFTLISATISNTLAGIYYYVGFNRKRKKT